MSCVKTLKWKKINLEYSGFSLLKKKTNSFLVEKKPLVSEEEPTMLDCSLRSREKRSHHGHLLDCSLRSREKRSHHGHLPFAQRGPFSRGRWRNWRGFADSTRPLFAEGSCTKLWKVWFLDSSSVKGLLANCWVVLVHTKPLAPIPPWVLLEAVDWLLSTGW